MPSAGWPLSWSILLALRRRGIELCWLTHAAGLSSTGDPELDRALPLAERYDLPELTVAAIARARRRGGRIIAVGTTVVRALEGAERNARAEGASPGTLLPGSALTDLLLDDKTQPAVVDGLLTGMHGPGESHFRLMSALAPEPLLQTAWDHAARLGYLCHEFGDLCLVLASSLVSAKDPELPDRHGKAAVD
jgi:S-adenosylmethionine:tRNA ribosyltransferase-isomerase